MSHSGDKIKVASCISLVFLSLLALLPTADSEQKRPVDSAVSGATDIINTPGSNILEFVVPNPTGPAVTFPGLTCQVACLKNKDCIAWTFVKPNTLQGPQGKCWLKNDFLAEKTNEACISGTLGEGNTDRPGSDYTHFDNVMGLELTARFCRDICQQDTKCKAWTFVKPHPPQSKGECWLKDTVPNPVASNCCISGFFEIVQNPK